MTASSMYFLDVNICIHAMRPHVTPRGAEVRDWLLSRLSGSENVGISEFVLASMTRIVTQHRIYTDPATPQECMDFSDRLMDAPAAITVRPGPRHWPIFRELVTAHRLRGNDVADAYLASLAMEHGASMVTLDRGFTRFEGLRTVDPLA
ncbi:MAG: PIN domain-containing protein [Propionibacteriales bacterium]|nr:PIN domain-containing protein [Propionibacteriales bacterium]